MVTKANMATHVDGNILEVSFQLTKRYFPNWQIYGSFPNLNLPLYRVFFLTGPPDFQYQNEKQVAANQD